LPGFWHQKGEQFQVRIDIREQAKECIALFFVDKKYWAGGLIPHKKLYSEENVLTVMQTNIVDAMTVAYACLETKMPENYKDMHESDGKIRKDWDVRLCYEVIKSCSRRGIPKSCAGGILLVYLSICQGVNYLEKLKEFNSSLSKYYNSTI
jgi:hypothetical protein